MSEITKLYENAGVELVADVKFPTKDVNYNVGYPPFTAEKVLKTIVLFLNEGVKFDFSVEKNTKISVENFKECIAQIGAKYWQDLTEEEKQQIKEILE